MQYSVVIPTNRPIASVLPTLQSLQKQSIASTQIIIVYDKILTQHDYDTMQQVIHHNLQTGMLDRILLLTNISHDLDIGRGVSYLRNTGIAHSTADYILCLDDDNTLASDFAERLFLVAHTAQEKYNKHCLIVPTEYYRNTIRSRGYRKFSYLFGIPVAYHEERGFLLGDDYVGHIQFAASNCLFGHSDIFRAHPFDESIPFVYEDYVMTASVYRAKIPVLVSHAIIVNHHMRAKTVLEDSYIATPSQAYQKARNRIAFVRVLGNPVQKFVYFLFGLHIHSLALIGKVIRYTTGFITGYMLIYAIIRGTRDGLFAKK